MTTDDFCFYLQNRLIPTGQTGGQLYSDTFPFSVPWSYAQIIFPAGFGGQGVSIRILVFAGGINKNPTVWLVGAIPHPKSAFKKIIHSKI